MFIGLLTNIYEVPAGCVGWSSSTKVVFSTLQIGKQNQKKTWASLSAPKPQEGSRVQRNTASPTTHPRAQISVPQTTHNLATLTFSKVLKLFISSVFLYLLIVIKKIHVVLGIKVNMNFITKQGQNLFMSQDDVKFHLFIEAINWSTANEDTVYTFHKSYIFY